MGQTTIILMIITILSKIFGFVRESVMAAFIGAGDLKSIYTTAMTIPLIMTGIVVTGLKSAYIPVYNKVRNEKGDDQANSFTSNLINILLVYGAISTILIIIFSKPLSLIFSPDLSGDSLRLATNFTRILSPVILVILVSSVIGGYLNIKGNFIDPAAVGIIYNIIIVCSILFANKKNNPYYLISGTFLAMVLQYIRFPFSSKKLGFKYKKVFNIKDKNVRYLLAILLPIMISSAANQISLIFDNSMASALFGVASVSKIFYAKTMLNFITGVVTMSVATVSFPEIAKLGQENNINGMKKSTIRAIIFSMILVLPFTFGMMTFSNPIIKLAFERNAFTPDDTFIVAGLLVSYAPSIIFDAFNRILTNSFYSVGNSKTPVIIVVIQQSINIALNFILSKIFGLYGLAYATSISSIIATLMMTLSFIRKFGSFQIKENLISLLKILLSSVVMVILADILYNNIIVRIPETLSLIISVGFGGLLYFAIISFAKVPEFERLLTSIKTKIKKNN